MKQILLAIIMDANNNKLQFVHGLAAVFKEQDLSPAVNIDPLDPGHKLGYLYVPPPAGWRWQTDAKDAQTLPILYEEFDGGLNVGFADGHIERLASRDAVLKLFGDRRPAR